jgi:hypothetical protein
LDEEHWYVGANINHISYLRRKIGMKKGNSKVCMKVIWFYGCLKQLKSREVNLSYLGRVLIKYIKLLIKILLN